MVEYIELPSRMFCPTHKCYFSKGRSCPMCYIVPVLCSECQKKVSEVEDGSDK
jgi:hypothetical protein